MDKGYQTLIEKNNNNIMISIHTTMSITIIIFMALRLFVGYSSLEYTSLVMSIALTSIILLKILYCNDSEQIWIRYVSYISFTVIYAMIMYDIKNNLIYVFAVPMIIGASVYRDTVYSFLTSGSYFIVIVIIALHKISAGKLSTESIDSLIFQVVPSILIVVVNTLVTKIRDNNYTLQIEEVEESKCKLEYLYTHDKYTELYNRNYLMNSIDDILNNDNNLPIAIAIININGLKFINDFYGNKLGDEVIINVGRIIKEKIGSRYIGIHLNSDEYMIIIKNTEEDKAIQILEDLRKSINDSKVNGINTSVEYGIAVINNDDTTLDSCITLAKNIVYQKKMMNKHSVKSYLIESLKKSLSESDFETEEHAERTKDMAVKLGKKLGLSDNEQSQLGLLAILHDIGKMSIPRDILIKPSKLTNEEWEIMKTHTNKGYEVANNSIELRSIARYILHHHEKWDGTGYPEGLSGEKIPLLSRIITVVDSHDVMTHNRPYHKAMSQEDAKIELRRCSGTQFDPNIVEIFIDMLEHDEELEVS